VLGSDRTRGQLLVMEWRARGYSSAGGGRGANADRCIGNRGDVAGKDDVFVGRWGVTDGVSPDLLTPKGESGGESPIRSIF
jgi:hypothetical protein